MSKIVPVILCGGSGTRLWPRSRVTRPKPFIPLLGRRTLFEAALDRCNDPQQFAAPVIVVGEGHLAFARPQAAGVTQGARFIVEPFGRNTAPAIALAAHALDPDDVMLACPSDQHVADMGAFRRAAADAATLAGDDWLVAFGIEATAPETGYGYIRRGERLGTGFRVEGFTEKPDRATAQAFLAQGGYAWNGGIFAFRAGYYLSELARYRPELAAQVATAHRQREGDGMTWCPQREAFAAIAAESVDYAVMENATRVAMVDAAMGWSDIGNWDALASRRETDAGGNIIVGPGEVVDGRGTMIDSDGPNVAVVGLDNVVVVVDGNDVLVVSRDAAQAVGRVTRCKNQ
ncbi:MAG: mannose-1-phosphate guanylyltransferase [Erythrobacter sp.]|jgi:mannose-1-phosphate guanylyltransferase/mannose-6-phosphate isomerase